MATTTLYDGNGSTDTFTIGYSYLDESDVVVKVGGVTQTQVTHYTFSGDTLSIVFVTPPPSGTDNVSIQRVTSATPKVDFTKGGSITDTDLDTATLQSIYIAEENTDNYVAGDLTKSGGHWDATSLRLTNLADGTADQDAATKSQVDAIAGSATAAAASAAAASTSETNAATSETNAGTSETNAAASAASITGVLPVSGLTVGRTLVIDGATSYAVTRTETWEFIASATLSSDADKAVALTPATYARYRIQIRDYVPGTDNTNLYVTVSDDNGSTYEAGSGYNVKGTSASGSMNRINDTTTAQFCLHDDNVGIGSTAGEFYDGEFELRPGSASTPAIIHGKAYYLDSSAGIHAVTFSGHNTDTAAEVTHIKFTASSGNLGSGTITVWGSRL